jgi:hypothetical protein
VRRNLKRWLESGGTLVALGGSASFLANEERALSGVRTKRDVLDQIEQYAEDLKRERAARNVSVDPEAVWGRDKETSGEAATVPDDVATKKAEKAAPKPKPDALKREDAWKRIFSPRGAFVSAALDENHWLCFGLGDKLPVLISGSTALMSKHPVQTPVRLAKASELRLSGLLWPEARERHADTAYATVERVDRGQIILFVADPFTRGYLEGSGRLLLNALILGPGMGTSQPVPW